MSETISNPPASPENSGQPGGGNPQGTPNTPAAATQPPGGDNSNAQAKTHTPEEIRVLEAKANRWDAHTKRNREDRRDNRRSKSDYDPDKTPPEILNVLQDKDSQIEALSSAKTKLEVKDKVRDILDGDEYKDLPAIIKRAVVRNPLGFANPDSSTVEDALNDIQDYLDDELDKSASFKPANGGGQPAPGSTPAASAPAAAGAQTPPASGSGPSSPAVSLTDGTEGKVGKDRSTTVLQNILKNSRR